MIDTLVALLLTYFLKFRDTHKEYTGWGGRITCVGVILIRADHRAVGSGTPWSTSFYCTRLILEQS